MTHTSKSILALSATLAATAQAVMVQVTLENLAPSTPTGLYFGNVWTGFHDGSFDYFDTGTSASATTEAVAEAGDVSALDTDFMSAYASGMSQITGNASGPAGFIFDPGASVSFTIDLDSAMHRYVSFGMMVVPSNDTFLGNDDPTALAIFDGSGTFLGGSWTFTTAMAWDAGTEVNDLADGPAFVMGQTGSAGTTEGGIIGLQDSTSLNALLGTTTAAGSTIGTVNGNLFRISVSAVPEPSSLGLLLGMGALGFVLRRRR